jgi:EAL domain-containing protein (putative c-di-GMP-specific phosphodiesterase class I)/CheY-like chemotaxis protein
MKLPFDVPMAAADHGHGDSPATPSGQSAGSAGSASSTLVTNGPAAEGARHRAASHAGRVLVVDDEELSGRSTSRTLTLRGFDVDYTCRAAEALEQVATGHYDAVVSDMQMPDLDGVAFLRELRARRAEVAVVILTAHPSIETAASTLEHGGFRYLTKPFNPPELAAAVEAAVARTREERAARAIPAPARHDQELRAQFARALEALWIAFQPIVSAESHETVGFEALLRSREPSLPHPGAILEAAEKLEELPALGRAVRAAIARALAASSGDGTIFVNLHAADLLDETLYDDNNPLLPFAHRIVLEITERASVDGLGDLVARVAQLRQLRYRIAVDDLGAGYAGLAALATIQPDIVKFDMSLVRNIDGDPVRQRIVRAIATLARELGMQVVAEGVETVAERDQLVAMSCDFLQGYLLARPGPGFPSSVWP